MKKYTVVMALVVGEGTIEAETKEEAYEKARDGMDNFVDFIPRKNPFHISCLDRVVYNVIPIKKEAKK